MTDGRLDRYARRELLPEESRDLAQKSLDDPALFAELTDTSLARAGLSKRSVGGANVVRFPRRVRFIVAAAAAITILVIATHSQRNRPQVAQNQPPEAAARPSLKPALASAAQPGQPILLASILPPASTEIFRGAQPDSRSPRQTGSIVSVEDGLADIDLGSLDGVGKGSELEIFRGSLSTEPVARLVVTTVFRERARGQLVGGSPVQVHDLVQVADAVHLGALLEQVDALSNRGDADGALQMAAAAASYAPLHNVPPAEKSKAFNHLAVLRMLRGEFDGAAAPLRQAAADSPRTDVVYARTLNNLGVLTELRGDRRKAAGFYTDAQRAFAAATDATAQDRQAVEANLARARGAP